MRPLCAFCTTRANCRVEFVHCNGYVAVCKSHCAEFHDNDAIETTKPLPGRPRSSICSACQTPSTPTTLPTDSDIEVPILSTFL